MTPEAQRIAIAEACGWIWDFWGTKTYWLNKVSPFKSYPEPPDYLNDLNAMHAAEEADILSANSQNYDYWLTKLTDGYAWHATAAQRAESFLRAIGRWQDEPALDKSTNCC